MASNPIPPPNPLGQEDLKQINLGLEHIKSGKAQAELAQRAGIDVSQHVAQLNDNEAKLRAIKQVYFPGES